VVDPLVHHGQHFGRMVYAMCSVHALITSTVVHMGGDEDVVEKSLTFEFVQWFYPLCL
jgi:hypothetical protein